MAKSKKKSVAQKKHLASAAASKTSLNFEDLLNRPRVIIGAFVILFLVLIGLYKPIVLEGLDVQGSDVISNIGNTHQVKMYESENGHKALWNPYMFAGTPIYHRHQGIAWSLDSLIWQIDPLVDWRVWYLLIGAIGMFLLIRQLGLHPLIGFIAAIGYIFLPHFHSLIVVGHFSKLRALMWMPFVLLTFLRLLRQPKLLNMLLFTLALGLQMRTQHYQIIFYTATLLTAMGAAPYIRMILEKRWPEFVKFNGFLFGAIMLTLLIVAQPLFVTKDYTPFSTRGGNAVTLDNSVVEKDKKGVGFDYATNWSYTATEFWNLIVPKFHGGTSQELYTGNAVPQLKNKVIPSYWGDLPFTQSYEYMSVILVFLALVGIFFQWGRTEVKSLTILTFLALLLSLGKHFAPFYKLFFYYVPYFDKFRVPMMILTLVAFNVCLLAGYGLHFLLKLRSDDKPVLQKLGILGGVYLVLLLIPLLFGSSFALSQAGELQRYAPAYGQEQARQLVELLRSARLEILKASAIRSLLFFALGGLFLFLALRKAAQRELWLTALLIVVALDLGLLTASYLDGKFVDLKKYEQQTYRETEVDRIIKQDSGLYRVLPPLRSVANDSRWTYHYQSIGGYSAAKLQVIQDVISNCLIQPGNPGAPINLPVVSMLNGKYIVSQQKYSHPELEFLGGTASGDLFVYRNKQVLPRAFFVDSVKVISEGAERLRFMNSPQFDAGHIALLEKPLSRPIEAPDSAWARYESFSPNRIEVAYYTDKPALLVFSEIYYPHGWKAVLEDGSELEIYKTNHLLRSVVVPVGEHRIIMEFHPSVYFTGVTLSWIGLLLVYAGLAYCLYRLWNHQRQRAPAHS